MVVDKLSSWKIIEIIKVKYENVVYRYKYKTMLQVLN